MRIIILLALIIAAPPGPATAQKRDPCSARAYPHLIGEEKPTVYITFERVERQHVLLRLRNTSHWALLVGVEKHYLARPVRLKLCTGGRTYALKNGSRVALKYLVEGGGRDLSPGPDDDGIENRPVMGLPAGHSVIFPVRREDLSRGLKIYASFFYEFDAKAKGDGGGPREYRAYFSSEELAKALAGK